MMAVPFNNIPQQVLVPLFYAEVDNSAAVTAGYKQRSLLIGQRLASGAAAAGSVQLVTSVPQARSLFGQGSMLARMAEVYIRGDSFGELWCIPLDDAGAGVAATGTITISGTPSAAGTLTHYIAGQRVQIGVATTDTPTTIAAALVAAINANADLPVTASNSAGVVTCTARHKGGLGNDIMLQLNFGGARAGEATPAGLTVTIGAMSGGITDPSVAPAIATMGDEEYDWVIHPYSDTTNLDLLKTEMGDQTGRWSWSRQIYGHAWSARRGTPSTHTAFGQNRNDQHMTVTGFEPQVPTPCWEWSAAHAVRNVVFLRIDAARPTQTGAMLGVLPAPAGSRFTQGERNILLSNGVATTKVEGGEVRVERARTTYQKNAYGQQDTSYQDVETLYTLQTILRRLRAVITQKYGRHKLANDGTTFAPGSAVVTPGLLRGEIIAEYRQMEYEGLVENADLFAKYLIVERSATDPNRVDVLFPPDLVNQLRVVALLAQFRLQYPAAA